MSSHLALFFLSLSLFLSFFLTCLSFFFIGVPRYGTCDTILGVGIIMPELFIVCLSYVLLSLSLLQPPNELEYILIIWSELILEFLLPVWTILVFLRPSIRPESFSMTTIHDMVMCIVGTGSLQLACDIYFSV